MSHLLAFLGMPGHLELLIIAGIMLLLFGHRLPSVMGSLGSSIRIFQKSVSEDETGESSTCN